MSITTYTELKASIATWLNRSDLTAIIPDLVTLAESRLNREIDILQAETPASVNITSGQLYATLPTGFVDVKSYTYDTDDYPLVQVGIKDLEDVQTTATGKPRYFAISDKIYFDVTPDQAYSATMRYVKKWDIASDATNALLSGDPDVYLYASLAESGLYMKHPFLAQWQAKAQDCINSINMRTAKVKSKSPLRAQVDITGSRQYNITTDF